MTERQAQALRGLRLAELELDGRAKRAGFKPSIHSQYFSAGSAAFYVRDELPERHQHGNGAKDGRSWSGIVPDARFLGNALRALIRSGLAEELAHFNWRENQRSATYRLTAEGRRAAHALLAAQGQERDRG